MLTFDEDATSPGAAAAKAARLVRDAQRRAGMSQAEVARRVGVPRQAVHRIVAGLVSARLDTLDRILGACGFSVTVERRLGANVDRGPIRELLRQPIRPRLHPDRWRALRLAAIRVRRSVVVGDAAGRLHGAPVDVRRLDLLVHPGDRRRVERFHIDLPWAAAHVDVARGWDDELWRASTHLDLEAIFRTPRILAVASLDDLIAMADPERAEILVAVREVVDSAGP